VLRVRFHPQPKFTVAVETSIKQARSKLYLATYFVVFCGLTYSSTLKMEKIFSIETLVGFQWTAQYYITKDKTLQLFLMLSEL
jgi:hypothetical protein